MITKVLPLKSPTKTPSFERKFGRWVTTEERKTPVNTCPKSRAFQSATTFDSSSHLKNCAYEVLGWNGVLEMPSVLAGVPTCTPTRRPMAILRPICLPEGSRNSSRWAYLPTMIS